MRDAFASRFAGTVTVTDAAGSRSARAFLQPASVKTPELPELTPAGAADTRRWLLLMERMELAGPVEIAAGGAVYALLRWEEVHGHIEGVLRRKEEPADA